MNYRLFDLSKYQKIYFIGIKGVAMSGLAVILKQMGKEVIGSDVSDTFITDKILRKNRIQVYRGFHSIRVVKNLDLVVIGQSWGKENPEIIKAEKLHLPIITESDLRGVLSKQKKTIAVTGVHGKSTTTALLAHIFYQANQNPSWLVGTGKIFGLGDNGYWNKNGAYFIVEGDEYIKSKQERRPKFLDLEPQISIITSIEWEHVDVYKNVREMEKVFLSLIQKTHKKVVACSDWPSVKKITKRYRNKVISYGLEKGAEFQVYDFQQKSTYATFKIKKQNKSLGTFQMKLCGVHNALNACACLIVCLDSGISLHVFRKALETFQGIERRFDVTKHHGIIFIDDYGHHPTEIRSTLEAARKKFPNKRIWCVFQPHMASRTKALLNDFSRVFGAVDKVLVADIFASAREKDISIHSKDLAKAISLNHNDVFYSGTLHGTANHLKSQIQKGDIVITMGAGDVYKVKKLIF